MVVHVSVDCYVADNPLEYNFVVGPSNDGASTSGGVVYYEMIQSIIQEVYKAMKGKQVIKESSNNSSTTHAHFVGKNCNQTHHSVWIIDSGATYHMTYDADMLLHKRQLDKVIEIGLPEESCNYVTEIGDVALSYNIVLKNVLLVPKFKDNLLSVGILLMDTGLMVLFTEKECVVKKACT